MMNKYIVLLVVFFIFVQTISFGQSRKQLEDKRKQTQREINITNDLLKKTQKDKSLTLNQLNILNKQISARQELINSIVSEIKILNSRINENREIILMLHSDLEQIKNEYVKMIRFAQHNRSNYDKLMFILSANDFNQAYRRLKYIQQYSEYRKKQAQAILAIQHILKSKLISLENIRLQKEQLLAEEKNETDALNKNKAQQSRVVSDLQKKERDLQRKLEASRKADRDLQKAIADLIAEEIRKAEERRRAEAAKAKPSDKKDVFALTPAEQLISDNFNANIGKLPWPTERGIITGHFGEHDHPVLRGIKVKNDGVYISTTPSSIARAIFDGTVSQIVSITGKHKVVIIRHGNYLSVYSNLAEVNVKIGETVKAKQKIGTIFTDTSDENKTVLELQIWEGTNKLNPETWLSKAR